MRRWLWALLAALSVCAALAGRAPAALASEPFPTIIPLPNGFQPEGVATGRGPIIYAGSLANGAIYAANLRTGEGSILVPGQVGRVSVGMKLDDRTNYLFVAGGATGKAYVYDVSAGTLVTELQLAAAGTSFINDVTLTRTAAYFTNSRSATLYRVPLSHGGRTIGQPQPLPLGGDWEQVPDAFNANGIASTPNGKALIVVNSTLGALYLVDPATGIAERIDLGGATVPNGDGIWLDGKTLYVVQNRRNQIAVIRLAPDLRSGIVTGMITDPAFRVPTTVAEFGSALYAVNARFGTPPGPDVEYEIVRVSKR